MAILTSYDLKGKKDSFANWISNLSPTDTFFVSTTKKEAVQNTLFQWQTDSLAAADRNNAQAESSTAVSAAVSPTKIHTNVTQILRKAVEVSDTADVLDNWGRGKELAYQMEKAGKEIKRDLEAILLQYNGAGTGNNSTTGNDVTLGLTGKKSEQGDQGKEVDCAAQTTPPSAQDGARKTRTFGDLVAGKGVADPDTGAVVHKDTTADNVISETDLFDMTYNLYLSGSSADTIMFHPEHASFFSSLMETGAGRSKLISNMDSTLNKFVGSLIDPLGQQFTLVPNRFMPKGKIYFFRPSDWTQMILRTPEKVQLAKKGSSERYMIEMEMGLRHVNPYASGVLVIKAKADY